MEELLNSPELQKLAPQLPLLITLGVLQLVFWLLLGNSIRKVLRLIQKENRMMEPTHAFFIAIPLFNIYWNFMVVRYLKDSLNNEFYDRKVPVEIDPTQKEGRIFAWSFLLCNLPLPIFLGYTAVVMNIIGFVLYWIQIVKYNKLLRDTESLIPNQNNEDKY